ncbi:vitamin B12-dependent ribonucleotide reductase [Acetobacter estunensis]|uniref:TSCPD domain-containing protein n=1 Tax=Acetobacter estunensis TaxID=104097 RepID=UPI001C2D9335|nr:vitamin B12-dependent ribonucleotide reductase [Acetobacter estunensis]MBV1837448.1 vitamin B12-dependent ribonucleotide reductase [Acetobacter estunensis]
MNARRYWDGVPLRTVMATPDPDAPAREVTLPEDWEDEAASALAGMIPGTGTIRLPDESTRWIERFAADIASENGGAAGSNAISGRSLAWLLMLRQASPTLSVWHGALDRRPGFVINLAAFVLPDQGFAGDAFVAALRLLCLALRTDSKARADRRNGELPLDLFTAAEQRTQPDDALGLPLGEPQPVAGELLLTNLDACLAALGFDYDSDQGRDAACSLTALTTLVAREGTGGDNLPLTPHRQVVPGLAAVMRDAWSRAAVETDTPEARVETGFSSPGPIDALLGCEACGIAPVFSLLRSDGQLAVSTLARLAARGLTVEAALASALAGEMPLPLPGPDAHMRMYRALAGFVDRVPARPDPISSPMPRVLPRGVIRPLPERHTGIAQKTSVGGHRLFLRTAEYEDGTVGEIALTPARESAMVRGLMESFSEAVSVGLQYGAPLEEYVERFAYSCFGPAGTVEGDPVAAYATSILDYAFRALSNIYLHRRMPDAPHEDAEHAASPFLPFDEPPPDGPGGPRSPGDRRRGLRLVS